MKNIITTIALLCAMIVSPCFSQENDKDIVATTKGLVGGPVISISIIPAFGTLELIATFQGKKPASLTAIAFDLYANRQNIRIMVLTTVGKGKKARLQMVAEEVSIFPLISIIPAKTTTYGVVISNPNPFPVVVQGRTN